METVLGSDISWISVGDPIAIDQRAIYPIARISTSKGCGCLLGCSISPEALLIVEPKLAYAVSLTGEEVTLDQLFDGSLSEGDSREGNRQEVPRRNMKK